MVSVEELPAVHWGELSGIRRELPELPELHWHLKKKTLTDCQREQNHLVIEKAVFVRRATEYRVIMSVFIGGLRVVVWRSIKMGKPSDRLLSTKLVIEARNEAMLAAPTYRYYRN